MPVHIMLNEVGGRQGRQQEAQGKVASRMLDVLRHRTTCGGFKTLAMYILWERDSDFEISCLNQCGYGGRWDLNSCFDTDSQFSLNSKKPLSW